MSAIRADGPPRTSSRALLRVSERVVAYAGMVLPAWVLEARVRERMRVLGLRTENEYVALLAPPHGEVELEHLLEILRVGETRFFRHEAHVQALVETIIPELGARRRSGVVRAWSAGCASGEEAYTLAMILCELLPPPRHKVHVLATDVSAQAIHLARSGVYPASAISHVPEDWRAHSFSPVEPSARGGRGARYRVAPALARCVTFERKNLLDSAYPDDMDIIWCRNVFIYFSPEVRTHVARKLAHSLSEHGVLFVGYSENLRDIDELEAVHTPHAVVYRRRVVHLRKRPITRPVDSRPGAQARSAAALAAPAKISTERISAESVAGALLIEPKNRPHAVTMRLSGRYDGSGRLATELSAAMAGDPKRVVVDLDGAELLDDRCAPILRRARSAARATGVVFELVTTRANITRWLRRQGLSGQPEDGGEP